MPGVKIGKPYQVLGKTYVPRDDRSYDEHGIASWYGPNFHEKRTANGEIYDQNAVTAAHKTLPMPSWVEVTNRDNGRKLVVRINDRGPFVDGRIIDLSRRSAQLLGVEQTGLARVRVRRVFPAGDWALTTPGPDGRTAVAMRNGAAPPPVPLVTPTPVPVAVASAAVATPAPVYTPAPVDRIPEVQRTPVPAPRLPDAAPVAPSAGAGGYIQIAALSDPARASALASVVGDFGPAGVTPAPGGLWRVRVGPVSDGELPFVLDRIRAAGYPDARIVR